MEAVAASTANPASATTVDTEVTTSVAPPAEAAAPSAAMQMLPGAGQKKAWTAADDFLLKEHLQILHDFEQVAKSVKFTCKVTAKELDDRWTYMLYNEQAARECAANMLKSQNLLRRTLWIEEEEEILKREVGKPGFVSYQNTLQQYRSVFHSSRTPKSLEAHYYRMKKAGIVPPTGAAPSVSEPTAAELSQQREAEGSALSALSFAELEAQTARRTAFEGRPGSVFPAVDPAELRQLLLAEHEYAHEQATSRAAETDGPQSLATLRGRRAAFPMRCGRLLIGRPSDSHGPVDVNVLEEDLYAGQRVSRRQAVVAVKSDGEFHVKNIGRGSMFVNGTPLLAGRKRRLPDGALLEFGDVRLLFEVNEPAHVKLKRHISRQ